MNTKREMDAFRLLKLISCVIFITVIMAICFLRNPLIHIKVLEKGGSFLNQGTLADKAWPLAKYLKECHPHMAIIITTERVTMVEDFLSIPFQYALRREND